MPQTFLSIDNRLRDYMFLMRGEISKTVKDRHDNIVIIDIDDKALGTYGQWPWNRKLVADLLYKLSDAEAGIIGLDIVFAESDTHSPHLLKKEYPEITRELLNYDKVLATCLTQTPVLGGFVFDFKNVPQNKDKDPMSAAIFREVGKVNSGILEAKGVTLNIDLLQDSMYSSGFFNNIADVDGVIRHIPLIFRYNDFLYPSLALEMLRIYSGAKTIDVNSDETGIKNIKFGDFKVPIDKVGRLFINFRGKGKYFQYISAADILSGKFEKKDVKNKFVLVGTSALGLSDLRSTVYDFAIPGVEVHANAIDNILSGDYLHRPTEIIVYDLFIISIIIIITMVIFQFIKSWFIIFIGGLAIYGLYEFLYQILFTYGYVVNILFPFIAYVLTIILSIVIDYITTSTQKEEAKRMLGKKVSPAVMEYLLKHSKEDLVASKEVEATIFFSDIRSFTNISEKIGSPDELISMLNRYMTPMVNNIVEHKGTIDKFIGDAIMAYWNAPIKVENHADEAVQSAIEQIEMLVEVNKEITPLYEVTIDIGIGIHTGVVTAGDMGSEGRSDYTIIGDNVNLTSRLEGLTKQYGAQILISKETLYSLVKEYKIRPIDMVEVKGKSEAVEIYEVICNNKIVTDEELEIYNKATIFFREGEVIEAHKLYSKLQYNYPCVLYRFYEERCLNFLNNPQQTFTPILKMTTK